MTPELTLTAIDEIDHLTKDYADARETLAERVQKLQDELEAAKRRLIKGIKAAAAEALLRRTVLEQALTAHPELFVKPRTMTLHGIRVGMVEGKGAISFADEAAVIARIKKLMPEQKAVLIKTTEKLVKKALAGLDGVMLAKLGCAVTQAGDNAFIKAASDDVDKLVAKLVEEDAIVEEAA